MTELEIDKGFTRVHMSRKDVAINNFMGGLFWGIGSILGATLILAISAWIFGTLGIVPLIGRTISDTVNQSIRQIDTSPLLPQGTIKR